jgi:hypothetical protein
VSRLRYVLPTVVFCLAILVVALSALRIPARLSFLTVLAAGLLVTGVVIIAVDLIAARFRK